MSNYIVSARKYRPSNFEEVVGQEHITETLLNAVKSEKLAHAYLFCGPRGVGKTTCARILAKIINTEEGQETSGNEFSFNIFELDGASNNSVEDIRNLIDQVRIPPQTGKYKVYIIDEVHQLSLAAFNAFLKTLEEPPPFVIFILATTEKQKLIPTVLSRCQIFDFKRISIADIKAHLQSICEKEEIKADDRVLHMVAEKADGALRDALSIFDRLVSFSGKDISYEVALSVLNVLDYSYYFDLVDALLQQDSSTVLNILDKAYKLGFEGDDFLYGLGKHLRSLLVLKDATTHKLYESSEEIKEKYLAQSSITPMSTIVTALDLISRMDASYRASKNKKLTVEIGLLKMCFMHTRAEVEIQPGDKKKIESYTKDSGSEESTTTVKESEPQMETESPEPKDEPKVQTGTSELEKDTFVPIENENDVKIVVDDIDVTKLDELIASRKKVEVIKEEDQEAVSLDQELIEKTWKEFGEDMKTQGKKSLMDLTEKLMPVVQNDLVTITVGAVTQQEVLVNNKEALVAYFKNALNLNTIEFDFIVDSSLMDEMKSNIPHTPIEKFNKLAEQNPKLNDLKDQLNLDIDY